MLPLFSIGAPNVGCRLVVRKLVNIAEIVGDDPFLYSLRVFSHLANTLEVLESTVCRINVFKVCHLLIRSASNEPAFVGNTLCSTAKICARSGAHWADERMRCASSRPSPSLQRVFSLRPLSNYFVYPRRIASVAIEVHEQFVKRNKRN